MPYTCEVIQRPAQHALTVRTRAAVQDLPKVLGQAYGAIAQYLGQLGQPPAGAPFVAYHNMDFQNLDIEIGYPVAGKLPGQGTIQPSEIPGGRAAACLHVGPYDQMKPAYDALMAWIPAHGYEAAGACYEVYLNDPGQTPPEALQTQAVFPLKS
jgi:effector-binding domain-containing protein